MKALAAALLLASTFGCVSGASAASGSDASNGAQRWSPEPFKDEFNARLAASSGGLWLVTNGLDRNDKVRMRVYSYSGQTWSALPGRPRTTTDTELQIVAPPKGRNGPAVCVGDAAPGGIARVRCFNGRRWTEPAIPRSLKRYLLVDMQVRNGRVTVLLEKQRRHKNPFGFTTAFRIATLKRSRFVEAAPPLRVGKQALGGLVEPTANTEGHPLEVGVTLTAYPTGRWVASLHGDSWQRSRPLPARLVGGSMISGPVRSGSTLFFPVNQIEFPTTRDFEASIFRQRGGGEWSEVAGRPLNTGLGSAQASVFAVGNGVWAVWTENDFAHAQFGGLIKTGVFAARIGPHGRGYDRQVTLWRGKTVFPEVPQVVDFKGRPVFVYMRQKSRRGGIHATVQLGAG